MATTTGLSAEQLQAKISELKAQGKTESTSKSLGKYVNALKVLQPDKYRASDVSSAKLALKSSTQAPTQQPLSLGGTSTGVPSSTGGLDINKVYDQSLATSGVSDLEAQLKEKQNALDVARATINDNPYYSEATRVGRISKLESKANSEIQTLSNQIAQQKADAQVRVNLATKQYDINNQAYQQNLQRLNTLLTSGGLNNASGSDIASVAQATGFTTGQIQGMIQQAKSAQIKPQIQVDNAGNVTAFDTNTGKVLYYLGGVGKSTKTNTGGNKVNGVDPGKYLAKAAAIFKAVDTMNAGEPDQLLSSWEAEEAYRRILGLVGGDEKLAEAVFTQAKEAGGYKPWGQ